jgi:hypothetical protein
MGLPLVFTEIPVPFNNEREVIATRNFYIKAHDFGVAYDGANASVSFPQLDYIGPGSTPTLAVHYYVPSASTYNWSYPTEYLGGALAEWIEAITDPSADGHQVLSTVVTGVDYSSQQQDSLRTFIAGIIIGLAASALLMAAQEAFHVNDLLVTDR